MAHVVLVTAVVVVIDDRGLVAAGLDRSQQILGRDGGAVSTWACSTAKFTDACTPSSWFRFLRSAPPQEANSSP